MSAYPFFSSLVCAWSKSRMSGWLLLMGDSHICMQGKDSLCRPVPAAEASSSLTLFSLATACLQSAVRGASKLVPLRSQRYTVAAHLLCCGRHGADLHN